MTDASMRAWTVADPAPIDTGPLRQVARAVPQPGPGEVRVRCGRAACAAPISTSPRAISRRIIPASCPATKSSARSMHSARTRSASSIGDRIGIAWLRHTCGRLPMVPPRCREPVCRARVHGLGRRRRLRASGRSSTRRYAYTLPDALRRRARGTVAVCGHRRLPRAQARRAPARRSPRHLRLRRVGAPGRAGRDRAGRNGARADAFGGRANDSPSSWAPRPRVAADASPPEPLDAAILFAPVGELVPVALAALDKGGTLAIAGISLSDIPPLELRTASVPGAPGPQRDREHARRRRGVPPTRRARIPLHVVTQPYPLDQADRRTGRPRP